MGAPSAEDGRAPVRQLRVVVTAADYDAAVAFYRDTLGLPEAASFADPEGRVVILDAGRATLEIADPGHAAYADRVEGVAVVEASPRAPGSPRSDSLPKSPRHGQVRIAFEVTDAAGTTRRLEAAGARVVAEPVRTPWDSLNARLDGPAGLELTLFEELGAEPGGADPARWERRRMALAWGPAEAAAARTRLVELAGALPDVEVADGHGHTGFLLRAKRFAWLLVDHHGDGRLALWVKAPPGEREALVSDDPARFFVPAYLGPRGWFGAQLDPASAPDWELVGELFEQA